MELVLVFFLLSFYLSLQMVHRRWRHIATKMNCVVARDVVQVAPARSGSSHATSAVRHISRSSHGASSSQVTTSTPTVGEDNDEEEDVDAELPDEMVLSNLVGAPTPAQPPQATPPHRKHHDRVEISSINVVEGTRGEHPAATFTLCTGAVRKGK